MHFDADPDSPPPGAGRWDRVIAGGSHTCGLDREQKLFCWGRNIEGETGRSSSAGTLVAPEAVDSATWKTVVSGGATTCGIRDDDSLWCWGNNGNGQVGDNPNLGDNENDNRRTPTQISGDSWAEVAVGLSHGCAIKVDRSVACWGRNESGELGSGTTTPLLVPTIVPALKARSISVGDHATCAIAEDNALYCWGQNNTAQFGVGSPAQTSTPLLIAGETWSRIAIGHDHGCGITMAGALRCWGRNHRGQVGDGTQMNRSAPVAVAVPDGLTWVQVVANEDNACARSEDGRVFCWGDSTTGQLLAFDDSILIPTEIPGTFPWKDVAVGNGHVCFVDTDEAMYCAGKDGFSQLGDGGTSAGVPVQVMGKWREVAAGNRFTCGINTNGKVQCAGRNGLGQLGTGNDIFAQTMTQTSGTLLDGALRLTAGVDHACAQLGTTTYCWGANYNYQLGLAGEQERFVPEPVLAGGTLPSAHMHTCAIGAGSHIFCWGSNERLQINSSTGEVQSPTDLTPSSTWLQVTAGRYHTCGITSGNAVYCKGDRQRIGNPTPPAADDPMFQFVNVAAATQIAAGAYHTCAVSSTNNTGYCWGAGYAGQLGQGDTGARFGPVTVTGAWSKFSGGEVHTCGIRVGGALSCWGDNTFGQLGTTSPDSATMPQDVSAGPWRSVSAAHEHTCAITMDDDLFCWGNNNDGQLANGKAWREKLVPVP